MSIRVIGGTAKGKRLQRVPGDGTRPVMDRVKEAFFNIMADQVPGSLFLDLYAGTGSVGIEALSRGADFVTFVEMDKLAARIIDENLTTVDLAEYGNIVRADVRDFIRRPAIDAHEIVYVAPPQYRGLWRETLLLLDSHPDHIAPDGVVVIQIDPNEKAEVTLNTLHAFDERRYGNTMLWFFERPSE